MLDFNSIKNMKNKIQLGLYLLLSLWIMVACSPQESDSYSLGKADSVTTDDVNITYTVSDKSTNILVLKSDVKVQSPYTVLWDLGNGQTSKSKTVTAQYPMAGDYTVSLTVYTADGSAAAKSVVVHFDQSDYGLIDTPAYRHLTGGADNVAGKVWVIDQYNNFAKEVANATGLVVGGHLGLGAEGSYGQGWWAAGVNEKSKWSLYETTFTFVQNGAKLKIVTAGQGYGRKAVSAQPGGFNVTSTDGDDATFDYAGGDYTFSLDENGKYPALTLSGNAFMGYYCGTQTYELIYQTDDVMALRIDDVVEAQDWIIVFCREELNVATKPIVKEPKAIPLADNFELIPLTWIPEKMGVKSGLADNPAPVPINESDKVYRYQKSSEFYSNLYFIADTYKFDLRKQNQIHLKVFIPSYNDYTTEFAVAGDWITNKKLLPQISIKLQDTSMGSNAWQNQAEIIKANLEKDKWLDLTFDFSTVKDRSDYDKIIIQFGSEGHAAPGIFYMDDFSFTE